MKKKYQTIPVNGHLHVVTPFQADGRMELANYRGTYCALVGVLFKGETLDEFLIRANRMPKIKPARKAYTRKTKISK
jgi:hypothetical protein